MDSIEKIKIKEFGNPSAYFENKLYHLFAEVGQKDLYYSLVFYGLKKDLPSVLKLNSRYEHLLSKIIQYQQKRIKQITKYINLCRSPAKWLDMGCGVGQFLNSLINSKNNFVVGSDISVNVLHKANSLLQRNTLYKKYNLVNQDELKLPFKNNSFNYILSADVLEHVGYENQKEVIGEMYRVLKIGGKVILHTPNNSRIILTTLCKKACYLLKGINPFIIKHSFPKDHISLSKASRLKKICKSVGFSLKLYYQMDFKLYNLFPLAFRRLIVPFARSYILILSK